MKNIKAKDVAAQFKWDLGEVNEFCSDVLKAVNDHNIAAALSALGYGDHDLACEFVMFDKEHAATGHLTEPLFRRQTELMERLIKLSEGR